ncbi:MAG: hypothetical protein K1W41_00950 [Lachnospiraceae bacterium]
MEIVNFEEVKARRQSKTRKHSKTRKQSKVKMAKYSSEKHSPATDNGVSELQRQYREYAEFCNRWYDEHVIGQDKDGSWIYKDL